MLRGIKVRLYPTVKQKKVLEDHFNGYRYAYNLCLEYKSHMWKYHKISKSGYDMQKELCVLIKDITWLKCCKVECVREAAIDVEKSFKRFWEGAGYPKFKGRKNKPKFVASQNVTARSSKISFYGNQFKYKTSSKYEEILKGKIKRCTFSKDKTGDYWASLLVDDSSPVIAKNATCVVGIDLGIKAFITTSEGISIPNNKYLEKSQHQLTWMQRKHSKSKKAGKNREKIRVKIAKLYRRVVWQREHFFHQVVNQLISENQTIVIESLKVQNMLKNRKLARVVSDVSWGEFIRILEYKCNWYGKQVIKIGTYEPSSKMCSNCGNVKDKLLLSERVYNCNECGHIQDRDLNAAINIKQIGTRMPEFKPVENTQ